MGLPLLAHRHEFQAALLTWYRAHARTLPWRVAPSLYKTVVSEFMLQQTQVKTVLPYFHRWTEALPSFAALAAASESQVLKLWEGLGYYSRARNLHRLAQTLVSRPHQPRTPEDWRELPGIGPYTAAAITSITFGAPVACVDGNVVRILARLTADATTFRDSASAAKAFTPLASALVAVEQPGEHNQAMMELGATVCARQNPQCLLCPVRSFCAAAAGNQPAAYPRLAPKVMEKRHVVRIWCVTRHALLLHRASADAPRFANMHELPTAAQAHIEEKVAQGGSLLARKRRGITRYQITEEIRQVKPSLPIAGAASGLVWVPLHQLESIPFSGPHRRWVREILAQSLNRSA